VDLDHRVRELLEADDAIAAATLVIDELGAEILGYLRKLNDEEDVGDVFARWGEDVWHGLPGFRGKRSLRAWCYLCAHRASVRFQREPWRKRKDLDLEGCTLPQRRPAGGMSEEEIAAFLAMDAWLRKKKAR